MRKIEGGGIKQQVIHHMRGEDYYALLKKEKVASFLYGLLHGMLILMQNKFVDELIPAHIIKRISRMEKTYEFTLVLKNVDEHTENLEDSLYESGCDDALINFREGAVYLDFGRTAISLEAAVISAIKNVESASVKAIVVSIAPEDLVTESEIAKRLEVKRQAVSLWIKGARRNSIPFPKPVMKLWFKSPFWKWIDIANWLYSNHFINEKEIVDNAVFIENLNAVLEERDEKTRKFRNTLLKKLNNNFKENYL